jgi:predicted oxidoreductase (fatty acid repression mutant protein)
MNYYDALEKRRSVYSLKASSKISDQRIEEIITHSLLHTPTAFNSQNGRVLLLLNNDHEDLWEMIRTALKAIVPEDKFGPTNDKINGFKKSYGTVLFFEDTAIVKGLQDKFPLYAHNFPVWSGQAAGILQGNVWTSLAVEGLGASLQHYSQLIEDQVKEKWDLDESWHLLAQMPFGDMDEPAGEKVFSDIDHRLKVFK